MRCKTGTHLEVSFGTTLCVHAYVCPTSAVLSQCVLSRPVIPSHLYLNDATATPSVTRKPRPEDEEMNSKKD